MTLPTSQPAPLPASLFDTPRTRRVQGRSVRALSVAQVAGAVGLSVTPTVGVLLAQQVTHSDVWAGVARTGSTFGAALGGLPLAMLAIRWGRRRALTTGWVVSAVGAAALVGAAQWQSVTLLVVGLLVTGVGTAAQLHARFAATDLATPARRAQALSTVVWVGSLGSVLGPNLGTPGTWLADRLHLAGYGGAFLLATAALLLAGVTTALLLRPDPLLTALAMARDDGGRAGKAGRARSGRHGPRRPRLAVVGEVAALCRTSRAVGQGLAAVVTAQVLMVTVMTMAPVHLSAEGGSLTIVGISISLHIVGMYGLSPLAGAAADRFGTAAGIMLGAGLFAASFALAIADPTSMTAVMVSLVLLGLGWSFMGVAGAASLSAHIPEGRRPRIQGFADTASNLAAALGALVGGPVMHVVGYNGLAVVAAVAMAPLCLLLLTRRAAVR